MSEKTSVFHQEIQTKYVSIPATTIILKKEKYPKGVEPHHNSEDTGRLKTALEAPQLNRLLHGNVFIAGCP